MDCGTTQGANPPLVDEEGFCLVVNKNNKCRRSNNEGDSKKKQRTNDAKSLTYEGKVIISILLRQKIDLNNFENQINFFR